MLTLHETIPFTVGRARFAHIFVVIQTERKEAINSVGDIAYYSFLYYVMYLYNFTTKSVVKSC